MIAKHHCKACPTIMVYEQRTRRRNYCTVCRPVVQRKLNLEAQKMRRAKYGRWSIKSQREELI